MDDVATYALLTTSFFFVALSFALLFRYRQVSQRINASTDLGHDLWSSLEQRLKKQDERILDLMGRLEVIQARVMVAAAARVPVVLGPLPPVAPPAPVAEEKPDVGLAPGPAQPRELQGSQPPQGSTLDPTQLKALDLLKDAPKSTSEIVKALGKSREHTARLMKDLFEMGLVQRNASSKPFVYQLTEAGRSRLAG